MLNYFKSLKLWFYWRYRHVIHRMYKMYIWFPIIWKDFDFDYGFLLLILKTKLETMQKHYTNNGETFITQRVTLALNLLNKIYIDHYYENEYLETLEDLYGKSTIDFVNEGNGYKLKTFYERPYTDEEIQKIEEHRFLLIEKCEYKNKKAKRIFWKIIEHNIDSWWD